MEHKYNSIDVCTTTDQLHFIRKNRLWPNWSFEKKRKGILNTYRRFRFGIRTRDFELFDLFAQCCYLYKEKVGKKYLLIG